jgi:hypothetical protein
MAQWLCADAVWHDGLPVCRFAAEQADQPLELTLYLKLDAPGPADDWHPRPDLPGALARVSATADPHIVRVVVSVPPPADPRQDDSLGFRLSGEGNPAVPDCRIELRRTVCRISSALVERNAEDPPVRDQTRAALLWHGWRRYQEVAGLKRFTSGKSGSDVLVFRPRLRDPLGDLPEGCLVPGAISTAWGSPLLVKTGAEHKVREEWLRFQTFLVDRLHPFMSRSEAYLTVQLATPPRTEEPGDLPIAAPQPAATVIGSFLGGDLLQAEPLEQLVQGGADADRCIAVLDEVFSVLKTWYSGSAVKPLGQWHRIFAGAAPDGPIRLFGLYDLSDDVQRQAYRTPLAWDIPFIQEEHLSHHLLGRSGRRDGLLYRLMQWDARFSLVHGDLHSRNVLADEENVWLLDFGATCVAPTLFDFAKLEVYLRAWCLRLRPRGKNFEAAAQRFEHQLLDHLTGSEAGLEPLRELADSLGASPQELLKVARCICAIRRGARAYSLGTPDQRDYLAVLYLTVLDSLRFAGRDAQLTENFRLLVSFAWVLEDVLSRMAGMQPYPRNRQPVDLQRVVTRPWLAEPGAPARVKYLVQSPVDWRALEPLAATRGVTQNDNHHLDVFDHTLLTLAYLERLLDDPIGGLTDPAALDQRVADDLRRQGIELPAFARPIEAGSRPDLTGLDEQLEELRRLLAGILDADARDVLKWAVLFHDVGKPATRCLNRTGKKDDRRLTVQFLGHEVYGQQLVADHLKILFAGRDDLLERVNYLILEHHDHHNLIGRYARSAKDKPSEAQQKDQCLEALRRSALEPELSREERKFLGRFFDPEKSPHGPHFPLLVLHGFADVCACRGPATTHCLATVAEIDLRLLAAWNQHFRESCPKS